MKILKFGLRFWMTFISLISFLGGWILLAHAPKPNQNNSIYSNMSTASMPTLEPLPPLSDGNTQGNDPPTQSWFNLQPGNNAFRPRFRTGGS